MREERRNHQFRSPSNTTSHVKPLGVVLRSRRLPPPTGADGDPAHPRGVGKRYWLGTGGAGSFGGWKIITDVSTNIGIQGA